MPKAVAKGGWAGELMIEFPDIGVEFIPVTDCLRSTIITISRSWRIICFNNSFSCVLKTPAFRSFWNFCSSKEFFFPVGMQSGEMSKYSNGTLWLHYTTGKGQDLGTVAKHAACICTWKTFRHFKRICRRAWCKMYIFTALISTF